MMINVPTKLRGSAAEHTKRSRPAGNFMRGARIITLCYIFFDFLLLLCGVVWLYKNVIALHEFLLMISLDFSIYFSENMKLYSVV